MNNKGQTVLSLAASHNSPATVSAIEAAEEQEGHLDAIWEERLAALSESDKPRVRRGGWLDFLSSHPDGVRYGDLDPRFVPADELAQLLLMAASRRAMPSILPPMRVGGSRSMHQDARGSRTIRSLSRPLAAIMHISSAPPKRSTPIAHSRHHLVKRSMRCSTRASDLWRLC